MSVGTYLSGTGHAALIVWMIAGWGMASEPLPFEVTEVSVVSGAEFAALSQGAQPELPPSEPAALNQPDVPLVNETPPAPVVETPPEIAPPPAPVEPPAQETPPEAVCRIGQFTASRSAPSAACCARNRGATAPRCLCRT